uniref:Sushi domain-containing protein n=1 Tax=Dromaius novaehollandiae TaxID=8790 RepID=A0A8C4K4H1_DRONO
MGTGSNRNFSLLVLLFCVHMHLLPNPVTYLEEYKNEIDFPVGKTVTYTCRPGYAKHPGMSPTITCLDSGVWSEALEFCKTGCNAPTRLVFAELKKEYSNQTVFAVGKAVEYVCRPGYARHPGIRPSVMCLQNRTWSAALEFCKMLLCPSPPSIKNGQHHGKNVKVFIPGMSVKYHCDPGYALTGTTQVSCLPSGTWSIPYPRCEGVLSA